MKTLVPAIVTDSRLISSNVLETDYLEYSPGTTYSLSDKVIVTDSGVHNVYESLVASNVGAYPPDNLTGLAPKWLEVGKTNRWRMFDAYVNSMTERSGGIEVVLDTSHCDSIALFEVYCDSLHVETKQGSTVIFSQSFSLLENTSSAWSDYFYTSINLKNTIIIDIPMAFSTVTTVTMTSAATARCGHCVVGKQHTLGRTRYSPSVGIVDYSRKTTDDFGRTYLKQGYYAKELSMDMYVMNSDIDRVFKLLAGLRATPAVFIGDHKSSNPAEVLTIYGFYKEFNLVIPGPKYAECSLEITGLI